MIFFAERRRRRKGSVKPLLPGSRFVDQALADSHPAAAILDMSVDLPTMRVAHPVTGSLSITRPRLVHQRHSPLMPASGIRNNSTWTGLPDAW